MACCREVHDPADASEDLEPIMVGEREAGDPLLAAILESEIGLLTDSFDADAALARLVAVCCIDRPCSWPSSVRLVRWIARPRLSMPCRSQSTLSEQRVQAHEFSCSIFGGRVCLGALCMLPV